MERTQLQTLKSQLLPKLEGLCAKVLNNRALGVETAADVWTDFELFHAAEVKTAAATEAYVRLVAVRRCRRMKQLEGRQAPLTTEAPDRAAAADEQLIRAERDRKLAACMEKLEPSAKRLLRMRYQLGMTQESIGEQLGVSKQYAGRILARALEGLRGCVEATA